MEPKDVTPVELRDDRDESVMVWIVGGPLR